MRIYEQRQIDDEHRLRDHYRKAYAHDPCIWNRSWISPSLRLSVEKARRLLEGDVHGPVFSERGSGPADRTGKKRLLADQAGFPPTIWNAPTAARTVRDTGYIGTEKCHCFKKAEHGSFILSSPICRKSWRKRISLPFPWTIIPANHIDPVTGRSALEAVQTALKACQDFTDALFRASFQNILLYGDTGVGKTFLSHCIAKEVMDAGFSVIYFTAAGLFDIFAKCVFGRHSGAEEDESMDHIYGCDLLIIDDLGTELSNSFTAFPSSLSA